MDNIMDSIEINQKITLEFLDHLKNCDAFLLEKKRIIISAIESMDEDTFDNLFISEFIDPRDYSYEDLSMMNNEKSDFISGLIIQKIAFMKLQINCTKED
jgi:hypothetical protein